MIEAEFRLHPEDGQTCVEVGFDDGTVWLTQTLAELYQTTIRRDIASIYADRKLRQAATSKACLQARLERDSGATTSDAWCSMLALPEPTSTRQTQARGAAARP